MINSRAVISSHTESPENKEPKSSSLSPVLHREIEKAAQLATSDLAKYVFDIKNQSYFGKLFASKSPSNLVIELNKINLTSDQLKQFQTFTSHQNEYAQLFDLPPATWMAILIEEKIHGEDLAALIGSSESFEGAASGILNLIKDIPSPMERAKILFYLNHSADANDIEITHFFKKYETQEFNNASILAFHHILHNVLEKTDDGYTRYATEGILRIKPVEQCEAKLSPNSLLNIQRDNKARVKAALRIMRECIKNHYHKALAQLTKEQRTNLQIEHDGFLANRLDARSAKQLNQKLNGELSARNQPEQVNFGRTDPISYNEVNLRNDAINLYASRILQRLFQESLTDLQMAVQTQYAIEESLKSDPRLVRQSETKNDPEEKKILQNRK